MEQDVAGCLPAFSDVRRIFLADGDALAAPQRGLLELFSLLHRSFPCLRRIGMYATAANVLSKPLDELAALREAGLGILYLGVETGDDQLLSWMGKGCTAAQLAEAGNRVVQAGIKLSVTVLLGIGGSAGSLDHARATGRLLTAMAPDYVGALTTMVVPGTPLHRLEESGEFRLPGPFSLLAELAEMLEHTDMRGLFFSNHASNYLPLRVRMPAERDAAVLQIRQHIRTGDRTLLRPEWLRRL